MFSPRLSLFLLAATVQPLFAALQGQPMKPWADLPTDRQKEQQVAVAASPHAYEVVMDAAVDGVMTRMPVGYAAYVQGWQPNRFVRLENLGDTDVVNPWLTVNGKRKWRNLEEIVRDAVGTWQTDADKARAVYEFTRQHRFHACTWCREVDDAVKVFNVYGYTLCGDDAQVIADVWKTAGLQTRRGYPIGHCVSEVFYDGDFHLMDGDEHGIYLERDNATIAPEEKVSRDHDLIKRTHTYGILSGDSPQTDEFSASLFNYEGKREGSHGGTTKHTMAYTLRPGESLEWRWDHIGKQYTAGVPAVNGKWTKDGEGDLAIWGEVFHSKMRNGKMRYQPDLARDVARRGMAEAVALAAPAPAGLTPEAAGKPASATWRIAAAYVVVGGKITARFKRAAANDRLAVSLSRDGKTWDEVWTPGDKTGVLDAEIALDERLSPRKQPQYAYLVRVDMTAGGNPGDVAVEQIAFDTDLQMSALALPELEAGKNTIEYVDETQGPRNVRITHNWLERPNWHPPAAPEPETPAEAAVVEGTQVTLKWKAPAHPDGVAIADYRVQVSVFADMHWVVSPNFDKLVSHTASKGKTEWTAPFVGLLNPAIPYYWRVCAKDANGVWGPWSKVSSFSCAAPGVPLNVQAAADPATGTVTLTWEANPQGAAPAEYRVYASDERGFTISDVEYKVRMGRGFCKDEAEFEAKTGQKIDEYVPTPANFAATAKETSLKVAGPDVTMPNANKCFYRVVAVDARGVRSGASDYAAAPRPFFASLPAAQARVGQAFEYQPTALRSLGAFRSLPGYKAAYYDREELTYSLDKSPAWLTVDPATGRITGTPPAAAAGKHPVVLKVAAGKTAAEQAFEIEVKPAQ
ncbi:MAG: hypothetical protein A3K19_16960 [Lentisphaerae bacterium RIFOXYB12_FULL_65_16]|nr:MAG: hypothetical protein A3K18_17920 [Lentisphaerae bacterium RIFOXYA12_64_32]OGV88938.1 MAG: hypothetical protein A3K19_16960 [Lentisphaerae bacterium RIFOXYB12_FULL_65_16]